MSAGVEIDPTKVAELLARQVAQLSHEKAVLQVALEAALASQQSEAEG